MIVAFVERFYFVLRHGLTSVYQAGKQRSYALLCYRAIQITMILHGAIVTPSCNESIKPSLSRSSCHSETNW